MGAPHASSPTAPTLIVVRTTATVAPRTLDAVDTARRRGDRVAIARPRGSAVDAPRLSTGRRIDAEEVDEADLLRIAADHARIHGGPTVIVDSSSFGFGNRWIGDLTRALDAGHGVVVPVTNAAPWPNTPDDLPDARSTRTAWREYARTLERLDTLSLTVNTLGDLAGPCVALAPAAAEVLARSRPDGADSTAKALTRAAGQFGVRVGQARSVYVHDESERVLLSACLIMKDEEDSIERCLRSIVHLVDEVVIYDTGSTDGSIELARSCGASVIPGYWDDDFSRARNEARRACRGEWLLHLDMDEELTDVREQVGIVRTMLERDLPIDLIAVPLFNMAGTELAPVREPTPHSVPRLVHRTRCHWTGALHEHPMPVRGGGTPRTIRDEHITIIHYGYLTEVLERRDKRNRNARIAGTKLDEQGDLGRAHFDRARTYVMNGRNDDAIAEYTLAAEVASNPMHRRCAMEHAALVLINTGRPAEAEPWIAKREAIKDLPGVGRWLRARQALAQGRHHDALAALDGITDYTDGFSNNGPDAVHLMRAEAHLGLGEAAEAGEELLLALQANSAHDQVWTYIIRLADRLPDVLARAALVVPLDQLKLLAGKLLGIPPEMAGRVAEALWQSHPNNATVLALSVELAPRLDLEAAAAWAMRLRANDLLEHCPLRAIADDRNADPVRRLQAAYLGAELFDDDYLRMIVQDLSSTMPSQ